MAEAILSQLPLLVAAVALIAGALLNRLISRRVALARLWPVAIAFVIAAVAFGANASQWLVGALIDAGIEPSVASYGSVAVLSFASGFALLVVTQSNKPTATKS